VWCRRAGRYEQIDDYPHALADFKEAIRLKFDDYLIYLQGSNLYDGSGQFDAANREQDKATALAGGSPPAWYFNIYALILAAEPDAQARNGPTALEYVILTMRHGPL
jgi:tetratricopeptide (TPR) repeat protein